ncbi:MAG: transcription-repair coupling factor, partial [Acidimicrobiia bacterium]
MTLSDLPPLLRGEPALAAVLGRRDGVLAVGEPARAVTLAALAHLSERRPVLVAVPTTGEAERLAADLGQFLGEGRVELFPAWETLPFERVSPAVETMGRRLRTMWRLRAGATDGPDVVVAPIRALVQRLGPHVEDAGPVVVATGDRVDSEALVRSL